MAIEVVMPRMGLTMEEGTIVAWLKREGERVKAGEPLFEVETDKTTVEIEAPGEGILSRVLAQEGQTLPVGEVIGYLVAEGEAVPAAGPLSPAAPATPPGEQGRRAADRGGPAASARKADGRAKASPAARRLARELGVDLASVKGTGPGGRVVAWNVEEAARVQIAGSKPAAAKASPLAVRLAKMMNVDLEAVRGTGPGGRITRGDVERAAEGEAARPAPGAGVQPLSRIQRIMAERMAASFTTAPHFYLHSEVDARQLVALRQALLPKLEAREGIRITFTDLLIHFCAATLTRHPKVMAQWVEGGLRQAEAIHLGVAVDTPQGLIVPVIHHADQLALVEIARARLDLVERAQSGKLLPRDLELGVFTLTNLGTFPIDSFDPILNPPQAAILAVGRIKERVIVDRGEMIPAPTMMLSLAVDHRVLDGAAGARFLGDLVELLETPGLILA